MKIRDPQPADLPWVLELAEGRDLRLPSFNNIITHGIAENGKSVAYGLVKMFAEAVLILDPFADNKSKIEAIKLLIFAAIRDCKASNIDHLFTFADSEFAEILCKHFGFKHIAEKPLVLEL